MPTLKVRKWGNSLAIRIPGTLATQAHLAEGSAMEISSENGNIILRKVELEPEYSLRELCDRITPENKHDEAGWNNAVGLERFWEAE